MKRLLLTCVFALMVATSCFAQVVRITLKTGETKTEELQAFSATKLFLKNGAMEIGSLESISFMSEDVVDKKLTEHLANAGVKVLFSNDLPKALSVTTSDYPKEGDNVIILTCQDSASALFKRIGQHFALKGYTIDYSSNELLTVKTGFRLTSKLRYAYRLNAVVVKNQVFITAQWTITQGNLAYERRSGIFDWKFSYKKGNFKKRIGRVLHTDVMRNLEDFDRLHVEYQ